MKDKNIIKSRNMPISLDEKLSRYGCIIFGNLSFNWLSFSNDKAEGINAKPMLSVRVVRIKRVNNFIIFERYVLHKIIMVFTESFLNKIINLKFILEAY